MLQVYISGTCRFHRGSEHRVGPRVCHHLVDYKDRNVEFLAQMGVSLVWLLGIEDNPMPCHLPLRALRVGRDAGSAAAVSR
jgi:hypothetical protein